MLHLVCLVLGDSIFYMVLWFHHRIKTKTTIQLIYPQSCLWRTRGKILFLVCTLFCRSPVFGWLDFWPCVYSEFKWSLFRCVYLYPAYLFWYNTKCYRCCRCLYLSSSLLFFFYLRQFHCLEIVNNISVGFDSVSAAARQNCRELIYKKIF